MPPSDARATVPRFWLLALVLLSLGARAGAEEAPLVLETLDFPADTVAFALDAPGELAYLALEGQDALGVFDLRARRLTSTRPAGRKPSAVVVIADWVLLANESSRTLSVFDRVTGEALDTVSLGDLRPVALSGAPRYDEGQTPEVWGAGRRDNRTWLFRYSPLTGEIHVAKAVPADAAPCVFGDGRALLVQAAPGRQAHTELFDLGSGPANMLFGPARFAGALVVMRADPLLPRWWGPGGVYDRDLAAPLASFAAEELVPHPERPWVFGLNRVTPLAPPRVFSRHGEPAPRPELRVFSARRLVERASWPVEDALDRPEDERPASPWCVSQAIDVQGRAMLVIPRGRRFGLLSVPPLPDDDVAGETPRIAVSGPAVAGEAWRWRARFSRTPAALTPIRIPRAASFDAPTRTLRWTPGFDDVGAHRMAFRVGEGEQAWTLEDSVRVRAPWRALAVFSAAQESEEADDRMLHNGAAAFDAASKRWHWLDRERDRLGVCDLEGLSMSEPFPCESANRVRLHRGRLYYPSDAGARMVVRDAAHLKPPAALSDPAGASFRDLLAAPSPSMASLLALMSDHRLLALDPSRSEGGWRPRPNTPPTRLVAAAMDRHEAVFWGYSSQGIWQRFLAQPNAITETLRLGGADTSMSLPMPRFTPPVLIDEREDRIIARDGDRVGIFLASAPTVRLAAFKAAIRAMAFLNQGPFTLVFASSELLVIDHRAARLAARIDVHPPPAFDNVSPGLPALADEGDGKAAVLFDGARILRVPLPALAENPPGDRFRITSTPPAWRVPEDDVFRYDLTANADPDRVRFELADAPTGAFLRADRPQLRWKAYLSAPVSAPLRYATFLVKAVRDDGAEAFQSFTVELSR